MEHDFGEKCVVPDDARLLLATVDRNANHVDVHRQIVRLVVELNQLYSTTGPRTCRHRGTSARTSPSATAWSDRPAAAAA